MAKETKTMNLNFGPQHPAAHGVLRLILELDGEVSGVALPCIIDGLTRNPELLDDELLDSCDSDSGS